MSEDLTAVREWQPIETAPKDGWCPPILACRMGEVSTWFGGKVGGYAEPPETTCWNDVGDCWNSIQRPHDLWEPTHWQPLPAPPAVIEAAQ